MEDMNRLLVAAPVMSRLTKHLGLAAESSGHGLMRQPLTLLRSLGESLMPHA